MSKLELSNRRLVAFDVSDPEHRLWVSEYLKTNTWGHCPVRFMIDSNRDLTLGIFAQMVEYYTAQEFSTAKA